MPTALPLQARAISSRLLSLEIGRFLAASLVLLYHYTSLIQDVSGTLVLGDIFRPGHAGVPFFFVLSGFVIYHAHRGDIGRPDAIGNFALRRAIRLFPMFWLISAVMLAGFLLMPTLAGTRILSPLGLVRDFTLLPHAEAVLSISWSLRHELIFYLLFMAVLAWGIRGTIGIAIWLIGSFIGALLFPGIGTLGAGSIITSPLNLGFGLGLLAAYGLDQPWPKRAAQLAAGAGLGMFVLTWALEWTYGRGTDHAVSVLGIGGDIAHLVAATLTITGLVRLERNWKWRQERLWKILGGASYTLYLIHQPLGSIGVRVLRPLVLHDPLTAYLVLSIGAVAIAIVAHLTVERWMLARLRPLIMRKA